MKTKAIIFVLSFMAFNAFSQNLKEADKAIEWYQKAANLGHAYGIEKVKELNK